METWGQEGLNGKHAKNPRRADSSARVLILRCVLVANRQVDQGRSPYARSQPRPLPGLGDSCSMLNCLLADAELANDVAVAVRIMRLQVIQQAAPFADEHQEAAP